ncbi:MAG: hypothetical protein HYZ58_08055 [Acidobacteria bacterium]|nr:hypothetical protein [Acidobacteriota bacterium]
MKTTACVGLVVLLGVCLTAAAQPPQRGALPNQPEGPVFSPGEIQKWFDAYMIVQAQQQLGLSDEQYPKFIIRLKDLHEVRRRSQQGRQQILADLRRMLGRPRAPANPDEAQIRDRLKALQDLESRAAVELRKAYDGIDELLDARQQARFRVFEEEMERRKFDLLSRARRPGQRGRGQI